MKFSPVLPAELYPLLDRGDYHFIQAHNVNGNERITEWARKMVQLGHRVIVDNGVIELGKPDIRSTFELARDLRNCILVCPDMFCDWDATIDLAKSCLAECYDTATGVMLVPHGASVAEWLCCAADMIALANDYRASSRTFFGVPKVLDKFEEHGRINALKWITGYIPQPMIHLLGVWDNLEEISLVASEFPDIMGYDSTLPIAYGLAELALTMQSHKRGISNDDFNMTAESISSSAYNLSMINIELARVVGNPQWRANGRHTMTLKFRNKVTTAPCDVHSGDAFAIKVVAWVNSAGWAAYQGHPAWTDERVAYEGDILPEDSASALFSVLASTNIPYRDD